MRLDARDRVGIWQVYHCEWAKLLKNVVAVDEESATYETYDNPRAWTAFYAKQFGRLPRTVHQARSVRIVRALRVVLINEVKGDEHAADDVNADVEIRRFIPDAEVRPNASTKGINPCTPTTKQPSSTDAKCCASS